MSICRSTNGDKTSVGGTRRIMGDGNGVFDQSPSCPIQNRGSPTTRNNIVKNIDVKRRMKSSNRKLHRLICSHRPSRCDGSDDNKSTSSPGMKTLLTSTSNRAPPTPPPPPIATPQKQNRYSMMVAMMDHYSCSSSPASAATPSTSESTTSNSLRTPHSAASFSTFFSHSDYEDIEFDGIHDKGLGWIGDSDDEGSQTHMSTVSPLISKLLRSEIKGRADSNDEWDNDEKKMVSPMCKFVCSWSVWISIWILLFACSISIDSKSHYKDNEAFQDRKIQWINWDHIRYASSIFWTVGGDSFPGKGGPLINNYHKIITCVFMTGSLGFMGLLLGEWGDSIIRNYEAVSFQKGGGAKSSLDSQKCFASERGRQSHYHRRSQRPIEGGRNRRGHRAVTKGHKSDYGSLPLSSSNRHQWHDLSPLRFPDSSDDETDYGNRNKDGDDDNRFTLFPHMHWLLMQSLVLTTLSVICVTFIRYCEQTQYSLRAAVGVDKNDPRIGNEVDLDSSEDKWDILSTLYYAVSTATTSGVKNALEPVSEDGKFFVLLFVPLSVITSLHWMIYIAQKRMQKSQRVRLEQKRRMLEGVEHKVFVEKYLEFDANAGREVVFVGNAKHHYKPMGQQKDFANKENEDDNYVVRKPVVSTSRKEAGTESSLETFYELELQRMGLVDIETFRVLKRKYELQKGVKKPKETNV